MADLEYLYAPYYGVDPFDPATVGAKVTGQNLVISVWFCTGKGDDVFATFGDIVQPASQNDNLIESRKAADVQTFPSRHSAQLLMMNDPEAKTPAFGDGVILVLNPPPELKQLLARAVTYDGVGDPLDPASYTVLRSLMGAYTWQAHVDNTDENQNFFNSISAEGVAFGTPIDLGDYAGAPVFSMPLLRTSGADGQTPEYFDNTTPEGTALMLAAINRGEFFVPLFVLFDSDHVRLTVTYPHSVARG